MVIFSSKVATGWFGLNPVDLVSSAPWTRVAFTTYALSLSFFEAVILDALLRGRARGALILSDPEGVRAALSEEGARRVGRDYEIAPVACNGPGVFHPKVSVLSNVDDTHLLVGSGNLTFSGWGGNLEVVEHLHPSFAADAFDDAADFFDALASSTSVTTSAGGVSQEIAAELRKAANQGDRDGRFRLLHSLDAPIAEQIALYADELGGATRMVVASPYFDLDGKGIARLAAETGCDNILIHAHPAGSVRGGTAPAWPFDAMKNWEPVTIKHLAGDERRLHGKAIEVVCKTGRLLLAGSANATEAGLFGRNIEASVLRVQRETKSYWQTAGGVRPTRLLTNDEETGAEESQEIGILSAKLDGDTIVGLLLTPVKMGVVRASLRTTLRSDRLGEVHVDERGQFSIPAAGVEFEALQTGRLVLRLEQEHQAWEGFLSITVTLELIRRTGSIASKLIAMLGGTETPEDVTAILAWFKEDPARLPRSATIGGWSRSANEPNRSATFVTSEDLASAHLNPLLSKGVHDSGGQFAWQRAMAMIRATFSQVRGPWLNVDATDDNDEEEDASTQASRFARDEKNKDKSRKIFDELLDVILDPASKGKDAPLALSLAHFLTDRIRPERHEVQSWVQRILNQVEMVAGPESDMILATALVHFSLPQQGNGAIKARRFLIKRNFDLENATVDPSCVSAFVDVLHPNVDLVAELAKAKCALTMGEQVCAYIHAATGTGPQTGFDDLMRLQLWPRLLRAIENHQEYAKLSVVEEPSDFCPRKRILLPGAARSALQSNGVAVCDCCGRIILNKDC